MKGARTTHRFRSATRGVVVLMTLLMTLGVVVQNAHAADTGIMVIKVDALPDDPQGFLFTGSAGAGSTFINDDGVGNPTAAFVRAVGTYTTTQDAALGWDLTSISCDDSNSSGDVPTRTATYQLEAGETVTCTFVNTKQAGTGTVILEKQTVPADAADRFEFFGDAMGQIPDDGTIVLSGRPAGTYTTKESDPGVRGYLLTSITCDDANSSGDIATQTVTFRLEESETVRCVVTNTKGGFIRFMKDAIPDGPQDFSFTGSALSQTHILDDDPTNTQRFNVSPRLLKTPGAYTVTEQDASAAGFLLTGISCDDANSSVNVATRTATFQVDAGDDITCTFTNRQGGFIRIVEDAVPDNAQDFAFTSTAFTGSVVLDDDAASDPPPNQKEFLVAAGSYTVTQQGVTGWDLESITCDDTDSGGTVATGTATYNVAVGERVSCTFKNTLPDPTAPTTTITRSPPTPSGQNGWYVTAVHATVTAVDDAGGTGVAETRCVLDPASAPGSFVALPSGCEFGGSGTDVTSDGTHVIYAASKDVAGNTETPVSSSFKIDRTAPTVTCPSPIPTFTLGGSGGNITASVTDATSGPAASSVSAAANVATPGKKTVSLTGFDLAGNSRTVSCEYVVAYQLLGPFSPIPQERYQKGSTIPVKFALADASGTRISDADAQAIAGGCRAKVRLDSGSPGCAKYDAAKDTFHFNLRIPKTTLTGNHTVTIEVYVGTAIVNVASVPLYIYP